MVDAKKHIDRAFNLLRKIPVTEEAVDIMFAAKEELRAAFKALSEKEDEPNG